VAKWGSFVADSDIYTEEDTPVVPGTEYFGAEEEMVTISKTELVKLREDQLFLQALMDAGVDNWDGYSAACLATADLEDPEL
jgi:hypothetical protein